jgi:hypothetical protein
MELNGSNRLFPSGKKRFGKMVRFGSKEILLEMLNDE